MINEKTPEGVSSSDKFPYLDNIIDRYEIRHPKPSISRNTAKKMLKRDLVEYFNNKLKERLIA